MPTLAKSDRSSKEIANEFLVNIKDCWSDDVSLAMLPLGHMVMSIYYEDFIKRFGCPTLIMYGDTGSGKSTLENIGLSIFGLSKDALTSGGSSAKSNEYFCSVYNGLSVCIDDLKAETLLSSNFVALVKGVYKGVPRTRMLPYGRGVEYIHTCSPLTYSTNDALPNLKEARNRLNVISIFDGVFKAEKFKYHEIDDSKCKELSLILPELLKFDSKYVIGLYLKLFEYLKKNVKDTQKRIINNLAYAYTGAMLLQQIGGFEFEDLQQKIIEHAQKEVANYDSIQTPVERLLSSLVTLHNLTLVENGKHYRIWSADKTKNGEVHLRFHKETLISTINNYYKYDKSKQINEATFMNYLQKSKRNRSSEKGIANRLFFLCLKVTI